MTRPLLLDLFCGAGGAAMGYHQAGFDIVGVDINPQPRYPFTFYQADALQFLAQLEPELDFDAVHASPPCQDHSRLKTMPTYKSHGTGDLLAQTRTLLTGCGRPWVIENVPGADMRADYKLCGCMFGLPGLRRERWFETSWHGYDLRSPCSHTGYAFTVTGQPYDKQSKRGDAPKGSFTDWQRAMGIDWMTVGELAQAIPPAYTEYIGTALHDLLVTTQQKGTTA